MKKKICMVVQNPMVKGGIAAVVNGYRGSSLEKKVNIIYVESYKDGGKITKLLKGMYGYFHFAKVLLIDKPELVHIHSSFGPSFYRKLPFIYMASWANKPIINHIHGAEFDSFYLDASKKKKKLIYKVYNKCSVLIALSAEWKERLSMIVSAEKITIIENYSIIQEDALKQRLNRPSNNTVLFLGEIGKRKGCYDIPDVVEKVAQSLPDVKFVLGGTGDIEAITEALKQRGVADHVVFPGWIRGEDKDSLLRESDVFFLPSYNEGMPMSILDAMGYGLPVVSTDVGGIPKIVHQGKNGYIFAAGSCEEFASGIVEILKDADLRNSFCKNSILNVEGNYSFDAHLRRLKELYFRYLEMN